MIDVVGIRREGAYADRPGQSLILRPEDATRFDTATLLKREASVTLTETGRVTATGFAIPRIRGQDARLTEVYLEDELLFDPYAGLPLVDELDVRAFGELALHTGVTPFDLPTVNPIGALRYRLRPLTTPNAKLGVTAGAPYGSAGWLFAAHPAPEQGLEASLYARHHQTRGQYLYFDDGGTPYNTADDRTRMRTGNDRRGGQVLPTLGYRTDSTTVRLFSLINASDQGLPAPGALGGSARHESRSELANLSVERHASRSIRVRLRASRRADRRETHDPTRSVLGTRSESDLSVAAQRTGAGLAFAHNDIQVRVDADQDATSVHALTDGLTEVKVARRTESLYGGVSVSPWRPVTLEVKGRTSRLSDRRVAGEGDPVFETALVDHVVRELTGLSAAIGVARAGAKVYVQLARHQRPPSLLEQFGDGGRIRGSPGLAPERVRHVETGATYAFTTERRVGLTYFQDAVEDRMVLVPVLADTMRAQNLDRTRVRGVEGRTDLGFGATRLNLGVSRLWPYHLTADPLLLPGIAEVYGAVGIEHDVTGATIRATSRYQSEVYRDLGNSIVVPAFWVHDVAADGRYEVGDVDLNIGLSVLNVLDVRRLTIASPETSANRGATAYSDVEGYPLPGRQWRLAVALDL